MKKDYYRRRKERRRQLTQRGLLRQKPVDFPDPLGTKTVAMRLVERRFRRPIERLLLDGTIDEVGQKLGLDRSTISKWRKRLGLAGGRYVRHYGSDEDED